jgi:transposase
MTRATVLQEVRQMRFEKLSARWQQRILTMAEAGEMRGVTERTFRRWSGQYDAEEAEELHRGCLSSRAVPVDEALRMVTLYETRYTGWTVKHVHERWHTEHGGTRSYSWTKKTLQAAGQVARAPRRGATGRSGHVTPCRG